MPIRRKFNQPALPTLYFRDGVLSVPGYTFDRVRQTTHCVRKQSQVSFYHRNYLGNLVGRHGQHDSPCRGRELEGRFKCTSKDRPRSLKRLYDD